MMSDERMMRMIHNVMMSVLEMLKMMRTGKELSDDMLICIMVCLLV